ncbi:hypothetical protein HD553DRAFT_266775 [Filobasidium floriforme]|uniref:uncharacterized protein n=1 Tax=Filobasidium floriforme TaxID=5210 RepID=UPI001E8DE7EC|nr:uncharacterized protein HD553DRAFT_266775 [Filobasidium floriforme]KAH8090567.1 hypothetical protein HD553DRAFT_266775 [Filobasidium floriforme]
MVGLRPVSIAPHKLNRIVYTSSYTQSALFNFQSLLLVWLLLICTCTYVRGTAPGLVDRNKEGFLGIFFKCSRIGERLSPYVSLACIAMAVKILIAT